MLLISFYLFSSTHLTACLGSRGTEVGTSELWLRAASALKCVVPPTGSIPIPLTPVLASPSLKLPTYCSVICQGRGWWESGIILTMVHFPLPVIPACPS